MSKKQIYLVYACDIWKTRDSMRLLMATTSKRKVLALVSKRIEDEAFEYQGYKGRRPAEDAREFRRDFDTRTRSELNGDLLYCYLNYVFDGEVL